MSMVSHPTFNFSEIDQQILKLFREQIHYVIWGFLVFLCMFLKGAAEDGKKIEEIDIYLAQFREIFILGNYYPC
jgi:hypothetical protein